MKLKNSNIIRRTIICLILTILSSFILTMNKEVYSGTLEDPTILKPSSNQHIELRARKVRELDGKNYQIIVQLWAHNFETPSFSFRIQYPSTWHPSVLEKNERVNENTEDVEEFFKFENGLENCMDTLGILEDETTLLFSTSVLMEEEMTGTNPNIIKKNEINLLNSVKKDGVLVGEFSFSSETKDINLNDIKLKPGNQVGNITLAPKTGIKVMANKYDYYEESGIFQFTIDLLATDAKLKILNTDLVEIEDFDRNIYEYTIEVPAHKQEIKIIAIPESETATARIKEEIVDREEGLVVPLNKISETNNITQIDIVVTAEDGETTKTYVLNVKKVGGLIEGRVITENNTTHHSTIKFYESSLNINWKSLSSIQLEDMGYKPITQIDTNDDGTFSAELPIGEFDILIDKPGYLDYIVTKNQVYQQVITDIQDKSILGGDIDKDGVVRGPDQKIFLQAFGDQELFDERADYIEDGIIKGPDQKVFLKNFGKGKTIE